MFVVEFGSRLEHLRFELLILMGMGMLMGHLMGMGMLMGHAIVMHMNQLSVFRTVRVLEQSQVQAVAYKNRRECQG